MKRIKTQLTLVRDTLRMLTLTERSAARGGGEVVGSTVHDQGCQCWPDPPPGAVQRA